MAGEHMKHYEGDEVILREGEVSSAIYKVMAGKVVLYTHFGEENEMVISILSARKFFGELGFLSGMPSPYTVVALQEALVLKIEENEFEDFMIHNTQNVIEIMKQMSNNIVLLNKHINLMSEELSELAKKSNHKGDIIDIQKKMREFKYYGFGDEKIHNMYNRLS